MATYAFIQSSDEDEINRERAGVAHSEHVSTHDRDVRSVSLPDGGAAVRDDHRAQPPPSSPGTLIDQKIRSGKRPKHADSKPHIRTLATALPTPPAGIKEVAPDPQLQPNQEHASNSNGPSVATLAHQQKTPAQAIDAKGAVAAGAAVNPLGYVAPTILPQVATDVSALQTSGATFKSDIDFTALYDNPIDWRNTYIITLKRDTLRVEHCTNLTRDVWPGATLWWAIDGKEISDKQIQSWRNEGYLSKRLAGFMNPKSKIGKPKISCLMSHARVWEQLAKEEDPNAFYFVLEDDVIAADGFNEHYSSVVKELKGVDWDWVYLAIHPTFRRLNKLTIKGKNFINTAPRMVGNAGYLISRNGARRILDQMFPCSLPKDQALRVLVLNRTIDAYIVKTDLVVVLGQQGQGFKGSQKRDPTRIFQSNIWDK